MNIPNYDKIQRETVRQLRNFDREATEREVRRRAEPKPPAPYTAEELERDNPYNQWMHE